MKRNPTVPVRTLELGGRRGGDCPSCPLPGGEEGVKMPFGISKTLVKLYLGPTHMN